jgi:hypothetical protein
MIIERQSKVTGALHKRDIDITTEQLRRWKAGELIQDVCPHLTATEREFIMTGITEEEWLMLQQCDSCGS